MKKAEGKVLVRGTAMESLFGPRSRGQKACNKGPTLPIGMDERCFDWMKREGPIKFFWQGRTLIKKMKIA
jgi:hypothetical protein